MFKINSQKLKKDEFNIEETIYKYLYKIPPKEGRYIVLDTETTGLNETAQVVELGAHEIINGKLTGNQFHIYIRPRIQMDKHVIQIHKITNSFYDEYFKDVYENDKQNLLNFCKFLGNSLIFAHNAPFDMNMLNNELKYWGLNEIPIRRYRCSMRIFMDVIGKIDIKYANIFTSLTNCCDYFNLKSPDNNFHNGLFDSFMTSRMICKIYETLDKNPGLRKKLGYNQKALDYFFIDNIIKKSNKKLRKEIQRETGNKKSNKKILNNINNCENIKEENNLNNNNNLNDPSNKKDYKEINKIKNYNKQLKKTELSLDSGIIKEKKKKKCSSVKMQQNIFCFDKINSNKEHFSPVKELQSELVSTTDNQKNENSDNKKDEKTDFDFENEEISEDLIDELFSELL